MRLAALILLSALSVNAATYYAATTGSDSADGSIGTPWKTVKKAVETISAGDTIHLRGGTYYETNWPPTWTGGTSGSRKTIGSYPGEVAIVTQVSNQYDLIRLTDVCHWTIRDLILDNGMAANVAGGNVLKLTTGGSPGASHNIISNCVLRNSIRGHGALINGGSTNNLMTQCTFSNITLGTIEGDSPPHSIYVQSASNTFEHCFFYGGGSRDLDVHNFEANAGGNMYRYLYFNSGFKPIGLVSGSYNTAYNCVILNTSGQSATIGSIGGTPPTGCRLSNLTIYNSASGPQVYDSTNSIVENILVGPNTNAGWGFSAEDANARNCTFRNIVISEGFLSFSTQWYYPSAATLSAIYTNVTAGFVSAPSSLQIGASSYAIGRGVVVSGFADDYSGQTRGDVWDIGAYEYGVSSTFNSLTATTVLIGP